ncbi:MAG: hypothetical protein AAF628_29380 [Planctomycetota bacterium]
MKTAIVTTTIHVPEALAGYCDNLRANGHTEISFVVIGDRKTPAETGDYLAKLANSKGFAIDWWDVARQQAWLADLPELDTLIPYNSVQRRNLAYLQAAAAGAECIITIDDDNHVTEDDYIGGHAIVGSTETLPVVKSSSGWFNSSSLLVTDPPKPLFHRGFPTCMRGLGETLDYGSHKGRVVVNAGLWLDVADADAMSHLDAPCSVTGYREGFDGRLAVAHGTNMVFNSQNTAFHRDTLPAMFLMPMGGRCGPLEVGRYDDIWMSMFVKVIADHLGDLVCVGRPLVRQLRNDHDLIRDLLVEIPAMRISNTMTRSLADVKFTGQDYGTCYLELIQHLRATLTRDGYSDDERAYLTGLYDGMESWTRICEGFVPTA